MMDNQAKGKVYIIYAKTAEAKRKWMEAFQKEKERVREDRERGEGGREGGRELVGGRWMCVIVEGGVWGVLLIM